jgi:hypothetical protein
VISPEDLLDEEWLAARLDAVTSVESIQTCVFCVSRLRSGVVWRRNHQDRAVRSAEVFRRWSVRSPAYHSFIALRFQTNRGGTAATPPIAAENWSGIRVRDWVERLMEDKEGVGLMKVFMFLEKDGKPTNAIHFEEALV